MIKAVEQDIVLLFGMPRSGTTWLGKLFDSHPQTYYLHEPDTVFPRNDFPLLMGNDVDKSDLENWLSTILVQQHQKVSAFPPLFKKAYMSPWQSMILQVSATLSRLNSKVNSPLPIKPIRMIKAGQNATVIWKSIESMGRIKEIKSVCPNSKAIHILRHPCGHVFSTLQGLARQKFSTGSPIHEDWDLFEKIIKQSGHKQFTLDEVKQMPPEQRLAFRWGVMNDYCLHSLPEDELLAVRYEDVCNDPTVSVKSMYNWIGLEFSPQTEQFINESTSADKDSYYGTTKDPKKSAYRWQSKMPEEQQANILSMIKNFDSGKYYLED